jgi:hypothetical protein
MAPIRKRQRFPVSGLASRLTRKARSNKDRLPRLA